MESLAKNLESSPFIRILDSITKLSIIVVLATWFFEIDDRAQEREDKRRQKIYSAWQIISLSEFFERTTAKRFAIEDLISEKEPLDHLELYRDNFSEGDFSNGSFRSVEFLEVKLTNANFSDALLRGASFYDSDLSHVNFHNADLSGVLFANVDLTTAQNLTDQQVKSAIILPKVRLPENIKYDFSEIDQSSLKAWEEKIKKFPSRWESLQSEFKLMQSKSSELTNPR